LRAIDAVTALAVADPPSTAFSEVSSTRTAHSTHAIDQARLDEVRTR